MAAMRHCLVLPHTMDPRGEKLGGIETHVRLVLAKHPPTTAVLFVGIDETGDLPLGVVTPVVFEGRAIDFMPVTRVPATRIQKAATRVTQSTTLRFALGLVRFLPAIRRATRGLQASCEIQRFEFAVPARLFGLPLVLLVHNEGTGKDKMDSLLKRYWFVHLFNERLALGLAARVFAVNDSIARRIASLSARAARKTEVMSVSVDTQCFVASPFDTADGIFRIGFAGRLDAFKDPPLMFATLARLRDRLAGTGFRDLEFHYVGASDPTVFPEFAAIATRTVRHGVQRPAEVAAIMAACHAGIITSVFEGMPCYLLEMLATGRPVGATILPQFVPLIVPGIGGVLVERGATADESAEALAKGFRVMAQAIASGRFEPERIRALIAPYSVDSQMVRLFACHARLAEGLRYEPSASTIARYSP